jgi:anti-sigma factor (TIGR02949 family)
METAMDCKEARALLPAHVDRELGPSDAEALDEHLRGCADCRTQQTALQSVRAAVSVHATRFRAPLELADRVGDSLSAAAPRSRRPNLRFWQGAGLGAAATAALALVVGIGLALTQPSRDDALADEAVANHVRALQGGHAVDVASSDQHTVKPWFTGKLDYAAPVLDLTAEGFPLVGGRLDYFDRRPVAALVYRHRLHTLNVFVLPAKAGVRPGGPRAFERRGFAIQRWTHDGMDYWAVSDADASSLAQLASLLGAGAGAP